MPFPYYYGIVTSNKALLEILMFNWLTATAAGKFISTFFISMIPIVELRAGLPYGIALGLDYPLALTAAVMGNLFPVPFIILFIRKVFSFLRKFFPGIDSFISSIEKKGRSKSEYVAKYGPIGLCILVAIPLPGTGAWTGALVAALLDLRMKTALPAIILGVFIAAGIVTSITFGFISLF